MTIRRCLALAVSLGVAAAALHAQDAGKTMKPKPATKAAAPVFKPAADMKWAELDPKGAPGVMIADIWGDHTKGAFGAMVKFPAGFVTPMHTHTNAFRIVVVSGTFLQTPEGKSEVRLGPGAYVYQPGGDGYKHVTGCDKASECVFLTQSTGKFDLLPVEGAAK
jgi:quercetin dioxygenase-like cupin family protein